MKKIIIFLFVFLLVIPLFNCCLAQNQQLKMENYSTAAFSIKKPVGWKVIIAGDCATLAFVVRDPKNPLKQAFFFSQVGPVFADFQSKQMYAQSMMIPTDQVLDTDLPVIPYATPETLLENFNNIAKSRRGKMFMPQAPSLSNLKITKAYPQQNSLLGVQKELFVTFNDYGQAGEGDITSLMQPFLPLPRMATGAVYGMTAPKGQLATSRNTLNAILTSFKVNDNYKDSCLGTAKAINNMRESSIQYRQNKIDKGSKNFSDYLRGN